ncbi:MULTISPECIES: hypothetical protein [Vibrio]|uniref:hypothetical protein n=2 Tax=Vibrionaceae TaxID=641 RepID=UPI0020757FD1|nr:MULTISPECIES: hypothetical protein [Vibrio]
MARMLNSLTKISIGIVLGLGLTACSFFSAPEREPYYPTLRDAVYSDEDIRVIESNNILKTAIKSNHYVQVADRAAVNNNAHKIFAEILNSSTILLSDIQNSRFHDGLEFIIKQFTCELYASQQPSDSVQLCPFSSQIVDNNLHYLPFEDGLRLTQRLSTTLHDNEDTLQLELFLKSTYERPLTSLWGAVHELGRFKYSQLAEDNLVLTVNMKVYKKSESSLRWVHLHPDPLIFFVVLPSVDSILAHPNELEGMHFSYQNAKLLVVDSR